MESYSTTIAALIVILAGWLGIGNLVGEKEVGELVNSIIQIIGIIYLWYKRWKVGDINVLGVRK